MFSPRFRPTRTISSAPAEGPPTRRTASHFSRSRTAMGWKISLKASSPIFLDPRQPAGAPATRPELGCARPGRWAVRTTPSLARSSRSRLDRHSCRSGRDQPPKSSSVCLVSISQFLSLIRMEGPTLPIAGTTARRWSRRIRTNSTWRIPRRLCARGWERNPDRRWAPDFPD
jgi:hypothetical protein